MGGLEQAFSKIRVILLKYLCRKYDWVYVTIVMFDHQALRSSTRSYGIYITFPCAFPLFEDREILQYENVIKFGTDARNYISLYWCLT